MSSVESDSFSAGEQGLGYIYQSRFALLKLLRLPEDTSVLMEKDDDLDFIDNTGTKSLSSLKHKAIGDRISDLSTDFWKSVRIWLNRYKRDGCVQCTHHFFLFTTSTVSKNSFLLSFISTYIEDEKDLKKTRGDLINTALLKTQSKTILAIKKEIEELSEDEKDDFFDRIVIFHECPRIQEIGEIIKSSSMRTVRTEFRTPVYERLEGWWFDLTIKLLTKERNTPIIGSEVSDKLSSISEEYKIDNLPIHFRGRKFDFEVDAQTDNRLFVSQLREINIQPNRIENAILDYYRAFEQRSLWARENVLLEGEIIEYENRLCEEWERYRDVIFEDLEEHDAESKLISAGKELYKWAELNTDHLRIREKVSEPYVVRGNFHILANIKPKPRIYWHPSFLTNIEKILVSVA
jgi:hypothetical protein